MDAAAAPWRRSVSVPLGEAAGIDAAVAKAHGATAKNEVDPAPLWAEVSRLVLDPLQAQLGGVEDLFLSPDGELHRIPFAVLPAGKDRQRLLSEAVRLRVVTTRKLLRLVWLVRLLRRRMLWLHSRVCRGN